MRFDAHKSVLNTGERPHEAKNLIRWLVDLQVYFTVAPDGIPEGTQWVFDRPQYLLLNLAVGGNWPGKPDETTQFPQLMWVDYVRAYASTNVIQNTENR